MRALFYFLVFSVPAALSAQNDTLRSTGNKDFDRFLAELEAYKQAPHPLDLLGPCEEYKLVWHFSNHSFVKSVSPSFGEVLCEGRKTEHLLGGGCLPQVIGNRYYICTIDIPVNTIRQDVYYYERQPKAPEKKSGTH